MPPLNLYINQDGIMPEEVLETISWSYGREEKVPKIRECLEFVRHETEKQQRQITSIVHYLKALRDWVTYQDAYLLFRLYGTAPKNDLDFSLSRITFVYSLQAEVYLIHLFGWDAFALQHNFFSQELVKNLKANSPALDIRYKTLEAFLVRNSVI